MTPSTNSGCESIGTWLLSASTVVAFMRFAPVLKTVIEEYATKVGFKLKQIYDAETLSGGMSLVASTGGFTLLCAKCAHPFRSRAPFAR
jgi:hypothetical protein